MHKTTKPVERFPPGPRAWVLVIAPSASAALASPIKASAAPLRSPSVGGNEEGRRLVCAAAPRYFPSPPPLLTEHLGPGASPHFF